MKKLITTLLVMGILALMSLTAVAYADSGPKEEKSKICHKEGNGSFHLIEVSRNAVPAHRMHGDVGPEKISNGDTVTYVCPN